MKNESWSLKKLWQTISYLLDNFNPFKFLNVYEVAANLAQSWWNSIFDAKKERFEVIVLLCKNAEILENLYTVIYSLIFFKDKTKYLW